MTSQEHDWVLQWRHLPKRVAMSLLQAGRLGRLEVDDAIQEGCLGLLKAVETFREDAGTAFVTYAWRVVENTILSATPTSNVIRVPVYSFSGARPTREAARRAQKVLLVGTMESPPEEWVGERKNGWMDDREEGVLALLGHLPERERWIVREHVLAGRTLRSLGDEVGLSHERIRQLCVSALTKLRCWIMALEQGGR